MTKLSSFQGVRDFASKFVYERQWNQFHSPVNLVLALAGECGELCEIFQWKGPITEGNIQSTLNEKEIIHIGEEIADVFIYSTRLCDVCGIDLSLISYHTIISLNDLSIDPYSDMDVNMNMDVPSLPSWYDLSFEKWSKLCLLEKSFYSNQSIRSMVLGIQARSGTICSLFTSYPEDCSSSEMKSWILSHKQSLFESIAWIAINLSRLCTFLDLELDQCITDKFKKNIAKYPADLVRGSSAKYTVYVKQIKENLVNSKENQEKLENL